MSITKPESEDLDSYLRKMSTALGLEIDPEYTSGVKKYLQISMHMMEVMDTVSLRIEDDPAPIFHA